MIFYASVKKRKPKLKPKQEREEYEQWLKKHQVSTVKTKKPDQPLKYSLSAPAGRQTHKEIPSLNTGLSIATKAAPKVYTGDKILGIGTLHKSNAVPVFSKEDAHDIATMRRN